MATARNRHTAGRGEPSRWLRQSRGSSGEKQNLKSNAGSHLFLQISANGPTLMLLDPRGLDEPQASSQA
jgi:hypothetical protein